VAGGGDARGPSLSRAAVEETGEGSSNRSIQVAAIEENEKP
jgi:hypothetical protein